MSIIKRVTLTINKNNTSVRVSTPLNFYKNDSLTLYFEIEKYNFDINEYTRVVPISAIAYVENPDGIDTIQATIVENEQLIMFRLNSFYTQHIGTSKIQLVVRDNDGCQCTIPYFTFSVVDVINEYKVLVDEEGNIVTSEEDFPLIHEGENGFNSISDLEETSSLEDAYMLVTRDKKSYKAKTSLLTGNTNPNPSQPSNPSDSTIDLSEYAKKDEIPTLVSQLENDMGYLTSVPTEYVTESELNSKGYATTSQIPTTLPTNGGNADTVGGYTIWVGTQAQYDAIGTKSNTTIYMIKG